MQNSNELQHWGIKGMRWGVRRFQNKDGTLTPAGKKRQNKFSDDAREAAVIRKKKVSQMTNAELQKLNTRQQLERTHAQLNKGKVAKGLAAAGTLLAVMNTVVNITDKGGKVINIGKKAADKMVDSKILNNIGKAKYI